MCIEVAAQEQPLPFSFRESTSRGLYIAETQDNHILHRDDKGGSDISYYIKLACNGQKDMAGTVGLRLRSLSANSVIMKICESMGQGVEETDSASLIVNFADGEQLSFDNVTLSDRSGLFQDLLVAIDFFDVTSKFFGFQEKSGNTHAYIVHCFCHKDISSLQINGFVIPFTELHTATTFRAMFKKMYESTQSNIYNPDIIHKE